MSRSNHPKPGNYTYRRILAAALALSAGTVLAQAASREETVIIADGGSVSTVDPVTSNYNQTNRITGRLYSPLITYDLDLNVVGGLASEFAVAPDAQSITFTLRKGATFHDGSAVTAKDVAYSLERVKRLATGVASYIDAYDGIDIADDAHFTIKLKKPSSLFLTVLSRIYILNSALVESHAGSDDGQAWLAVNDAGSGPYRLTEMGGKAVTLEWYDGYWEEIGARPRSFVYRNVDESSTKRAELMTGDIDVADGMLQLDLDLLASAPGVAVSYGSSPAVDGIFFNYQSGPTADKRVREAVRLAFDYAGNVSGIHRGKGALPAGPLPEALACRPDLPVSGQDLEKAKALLAEAGISDLTLTLRFQPAFEDQVQEATLLQSNLKDIGITLKLEPITFPNYLAMLKDPAQIPELMLLSDSSPFPDPGVMLAKTYMSTAVGTNRGGYNNAKVDDLLGKAIASSDANERCTFYQEAQKIIDADSVFMPLYWSPSYAAYRSDRLANPLENSIHTNFAPVKYPRIKE